MPALRENSALTTLQEGQIALRGEFVWGSNYTFLAQLTFESETLQVVYKPTRGEQPLLDFPQATLARREVAAYLVSQAMGWQLVPPTVYRRDAPLGPGSLQLFVEHDPEYHYFNFREADRQRLRPVALFDALINNADRKGSHVLIDADNHLWLIDHGICFHREDKLRTVIWDFAGESIPAELIAALSRFRQALRPTSELAGQLQEHLSRAEIVALAARAQRLLENGHFPEPDPRRRTYPWPPV